MRIRGWWWLGWMLAMRLMTAGAAETPVPFVPPAEGPVPFRRDRLPLDTDTMSQLSHQVAMMALSGKGPAPEALRRVAQAGGLALALDPTNRPARDLLAAAEKGLPAGDADPQQLKTACERAWRTLEWLQRPEAGEDGQALAACVEDLLVAADPENPRSRAHEAEKGAWKDWIAPLSAFVPRGMPEDGGVPKTVPTAPPEPKVRKELVLTKAYVLTPLWLEEKDSSPVCRLESISVEAAVAMGEAEAPLFSLSAEYPYRRLKETQAAVQGAMKDRLAEAAPDHLTLTLTLPGTMGSPRLNGASFSGAEVVLLDAVLAGKNPGAAVLAVVEKDGNLALPPRFWTTLRVLSREKGMRLVLPKQALEYLTAFLVLEQPDFFMANEILLAGNVDELRALAAGEPSGAVAEGLARFAEIRRVGAERPLGPFIATPAAQQRLNQVVAGLPGHVSARLLALQGSGNRPRFMPRKILAREIRDALEPIGSFGDKGLYEVPAAKLEAVHKQVRELLDKMPPYIEIRDRDLHKEAMAATDNLRSLATLINRSPSTPNSPKITELTHSAWSEYVKAMTDLTLAAGDSGEYELPRHLPRRNN